MLTVYRIETFTRDGFNPRGMAIIENPEISMDYLTLESTKVVCKSIDAEWGDWCRILDQFGNVAYVGYVDNIISNTKTTELTLRPLQALFDMPSAYQYKHRGGAFTSTEVAMRFLYISIYLWTFDHYAQIPYRLAELTTTTPCPVIPTPQQVINNHWNMGLYFLTQTGTTCDIALDVENKELVIKGENISNQIVIETDKDYVLDYEISEGSNQGYNSVAVHYGENGASFNVRNYCLHTDGSIDTHLEDTEIIDGEIVHTPYNRIFPVKYAETYADTGTDDSGNEYVYTKAVELLQNGKWVNEIKITLSNDNKIIDVNSPIGTKAIILQGGIAYETILTGFTKRGKITTLLFGTIRGELTKQMAIERITTGKDIQQTSGGGGSIDLMPNQEIQIGTYNSKAMFAQVIAWSNGAIPATTLVKIGSLNCEVDEVISVDFNATPSNRVYFWGGSVRDGGVYHQGVRITKSNGDVYYHYNDAWSNGTMIKAFIMYTKV